MVLLFLLSFFTAQEVDSVALVNKGINYNNKAQYEYLINFNAEKAIYYADSAHFYFKKANRWDFIANSFIYLVNAYSQYHIYNKKQFLAIESMINECMRMVDYNSPVYQKTIFCLYLLYSHRDPQNANIQWIESQITRFNKSNNFYFLSDFYMRKRNLTLAKEYFTKARKNFNRVDTFQQLHLLQLEYNIYYQQSDYKSCLIVLNNMKIFLKTNFQSNTNRELFGVLIDESHNYRKIGRYNKSLEILNHSRIQYLKKNAPPHPYYFQLLNQLAVSYNITGKREKSLQLSLELEALFKEQNYEQHFKDYLTHITGQRYEDNGDYETAIEYYSKQLDLNATWLGENKKHIANSLNNLGEVYYKSKQYNKAEEAYTKALDLRKSLFGEKHSKVAVGYNNLGNIDRVKGNFNNALELHLKAMAIRKELFGDTSAYIASSYHHTGLVYKEMSEFEKALNYLHKGAELMTQFYTEKHPYTSRSLLHIAETYKRMKKPKDALLYYQKALLAIDRSAIDTEFYLSDLHSLPELKLIRTEPLIIESLMGKAEAFEHDYLQSSERKSLLSALKTYERTIDFIQNLRQTYQSEESKLRLTEQTNAIFEKSLKIASDIYNETSETTDLERCFTLIQKSKSGLLIDQLTDKHSAFTFVPEADRQKERVLNEEIAYTETELAKLQLSSETSKKQTSLQNKLFDLKRAYTQLLDSYKKKYPEYYRQRFESEKVTSTHIQKLLQPNDVVLDYFVGEKNLYTFILTPSRKHLITQKRSPNFNQLVQSYTSAIKKMRAPTLNTLSFELYQTLIQPSSAFLNKHAKLIIIPHHGLAYLPFETLTVCKPKRRASPEDCDYLIRNHEISYQYSSLLYYTNTTSLPTLSKGFIGFAPIFTEKENNGFIVEANRSIFAPEDMEWDTRSTISADYRLFPLKESETEIRSIEKLFKEKNVSATSFLYTEASETQLKKLDLRSFKYIHFATHGLVNERQPKLSGLFFSQPKENSKTDDGVLYLSESYNLKLNADLVTLSSCESGIGKLVKGEGMLSMTRGFSYAGAKNVLYSLWKVNDKKTRELMVAFYSHVANGKTYATALREAKLAMLANDKNANPRHWAGFVLIGN